LKVSQTLESCEAAKTTGHPATPEAPGWMFDAEAIRTVALYQVVLITLRSIQMLHLYDIHQEVITMKTYMPNPDKLEKKWYIVDASGLVLGRVASEIAKVLRGKNKPEFTPNVETGDYVVVINAEKIKVTGKKLDQKIYYRHSDYVGSLKETTLKELLEKHPERAIEFAVKGMLPSGPLGRKMLTKLHVYAGAEHPHAAQKPEVLTF
jgi:large subunit ribosomal protein L13